MHHPLEHVCRQNSDGPVYGLRDQGAIFVIRDSVVRRKNLLTVSDYDSVTNCLIRK